MSAVGSVKAIYLQVERVVGNEGERRGEGGGEGKGMLIVLIGLMADSGQAP